MVPPSMELQRTVSVNQIPPQPSIISAAETAISLSLKKPTSIAPTMTKRRPGRPRGTKNLKPSSQIQPQKKRRPGRPPGTKTMKPPLKNMKSITGTCSQPKTVSRDPPKAVPKRRKAAAVKRLELFVTISVAGADISPRIFPSVQDFLHNHCQAGIFVVERGGSLLNLHLQGVIAIFGTSPLDVKKRLTAVIGWADDRPIGAGVCVKKLSNKGIHTFVRMVGYCLKDRKELHFRVCMKDISDAVQCEGMLLYTFYGAADLKNRVELNPSNIMERALQYNKFVSHHPLGTSFQGCIRRMLVGGHYTPSTGWLINKGMDLTRTTSMWRAYLQPGALTMADVKNIFFWMPRQYPSRFIEGVHPGLQLMKTSVLEDLRDSVTSQSLPN
ncbi:hypothetical protein R1sor_024833 [Riccia sorocarpa]|uniref:Replitron HUH endonuclease domain-containing protein n=1 Tax=Riccia sorocarpa TaxID=122646 RepID=A0ABD3GUM1_9MARC